MYVTFHYIYARVHNFAYTYKLMIILNLLYTCKQKSSRRNSERCLNGARHGIIFLIQQLLHIDTHLFLRK